MPEVSIILPTYNRSKTLDRAIRSVLSQTYKDFELIVVDDGSTDDTEALIKNIMLLDKRVKYLKLQTNSGVCKARNTGILASSGKYIAFQDSDDEWLPEKLMKQVEIIKTQPEDVGMVYCPMYFINDKIKKITSTPVFMPEESDLYKKGLMYMFRGIGMQSCLFRREVFNICGYFDENMWAMLEDTELLIRIPKKFKFFCIDEPLVNYYKTEGGLSKNHNETLKSTFYIFNKYYSDIKKDWGMLAVHYSYLKQQLRKVGRKKEAKKYKIKAWFFNIANRLRNLLNLVFKSF